jgi:hypothetical protein
MTPGGAEVALLVAIMYTINITINPVICMHFGLGCNTLVFGVGMMIRRSQGTAGITHPMSGGGANKA